MIGSALLFFVRAPRVCDSIGNDISEDVFWPYSDNFMYAELDINSTISHHTLYVFLLIYNKLM